MKISIVSSVLILLAAAGLGWRNQQQLTVFRETYTKLVAEAALLEIPIHSSEDGEVLRASKRLREDKDAATQLSIAKFIAFAKDYATAPGGISLDDAKNKRENELTALMLAMDSGQLKSLIRELHAVKEGGGSGWVSLFSDASLMLSSSDPQAALQLFFELPGFFDDDLLGLKSQSLTTAVRALSKDDPSAALEWMKRNAGKFPEALADDFAHAVDLGLISGSAMHDPKLAFKLIGGLKSAITSSDSAIGIIVGTAKTADERMSVLAALRGYLTSLPDEKARSAAAGIGLATLGRGLSGSGFEVASAWLATAKLAPQETAMVVKEIVERETLQSGPWIEWIGNTLPAEKGTESVRAMVNYWTEKDYIAAGKWLVSTPAGPTKNAAIRSYAEAVARNEPETAAQWALTLPPGTNRDATLANIYRNWPVKDPATKAAAEKFKVAHGIR